MKKANREATIGIPEDYAEELSPLLLPGRRAEPGAGWLGDAGEYCGDRERTATLVYYQIGNYFCENYYMTSTCSKPKSNDRPYHGRPDQGQNMSGSHDIPERISDLTVSEMLCSAAQ